MDHIAVIADGHADARALDAVLAAIDAAGIRRVWCLGDFCSGGPDPLECYERTVEACELVLAGNHELFVVLRAWMHTRAVWAVAAQLAAERLGPDRVAALRELPSHARRPHAELVHGALTDPANDFLRGARAAHRNLGLLSRPLLLFGHTHVAACWAPAKAGRWAAGEPIVPGVPRPLPVDEPRLLNPGAVCDARGARWLELRLGEDERSATWHQEAVAGHGGVASFTPA